MRRMNRSIFTAAFAALLLSTDFSPLNAAQPANEALLACADKTDDATRLRCFDAVVADLRKTSKVPPVAAAAIEAVKTPVSAPQTAAHPASPQDKFGARGDLKPESHTELSELTGTVTALAKKPHGELVVTLDNGQMWAEIATGSKVKLKTGDTVKIERGALGSFLLVAPNGRSSKVSRIR
jgi:hypothetical protein